MSKNIYRLNKKSDLNEIMKINYFKPIYIILLSKSKNSDYNDIAVSVKELSKELTYCMILLIDMDDFVDETDFFVKMNVELPHFLMYFKYEHLKSITSTIKQNFIPDIISTMTSHQENYVEKLKTLFTKSIPVEQSIETVPPINNPPVKPVPKTRGETVSTDTSEDEEEVEDSSSSDTSSDESKESSESVERAKKELKKLKEQLLKHK